MKSTSGIGGALSDGSSCAYDFACINRCDNQTTIGLASDSLKCFSAGACHGGSSFCNASTFRCEVEATNSTGGASNQCDDQFDNSCQTDAYCDNNCQYKTLTSPSGLDVKINISYPKDSGLGGLNLTWTDNANGESSTKIYRSTDNSTFTNVANVSGSSANNYSDNNINDNTLFFYKVMAASSGSSPNCSANTYSPVMNNITADRTAPNRPRLATASRDVLLYYDFEQNSSNTTADQSSFGNDGSTIANALWNATGGYRAGGMVFDGVNDYIDLGNNSLFNSLPNKNFTIEAWVNPILNGRDQSIIGNAWVAPGWHIRITTANKVRFIAITDGGNYKYSDTSALSAGWHHVVGVWNGTNVVTYVDGLLDSALTSSGTLTNLISTSKIYLGNIIGQTVYFNGSLDGIMIYDRALSSSEISAKYNNTVNNITQNYTELSWTERDNQNNNGLILYMPFEDNTGTTTKDWGKNHFIGELNNTPTWATGKFGNALDYDGTTQSVNISDSDLLSFGNGASDMPLTISAWVYPDTLAGVGDGNWIVNKRGTSNDEYQLTFFEGKFGMAMFDASTSGYIYAASNLTYSAGSWIHITGTYDGTGSKDGINLYVNGLKIEVTTTLSGTYVAMENKDSSLLIGQAGWTNTINFDGKIDELRIYNRSLSQREIINDMQSGLIKKGVFRATSESGAYTQLGGQNLSDTNYTDSTATDINIPNEATSLVSTSHSVSDWRTDTTVDLAWQIPTDNGTTYWYNITAYDNYTNFNSTIKNATVISGFDGFDISCDTSSGELTGTAKDYEETQTTHTCTFNNGNSNYFHIASKDNAGNWGATSADIGPFYIDNTGLSACSIEEINESSPYAFVSGTTIYFNNITTGNFTVNVTATDALSQVSNVTFPATVDAGTIDVNYPYMYTYSWENADSYNSGSTITCADYAGNTNTTTLTVKLDNTAPTGGSIAYNDGWHTSSVEITLADGNDGTGSGVNATHTILWRQNATISGSDCGAFGSWHTIGTLDPATPYTDTQVVDGRCYNYTYEVYDNVNNGVNYSSSSIAKIGGLPSIVSISISPSIAYNSNDLQCNATILDGNNATVTVEYWWYNSSTFILGGNRTGVSNNTNTIISTLGSGNTSVFDLWNCTLRVNDGTLYSGFNSTAINISSSIPTHDNPTITPANPKANNDLTCNWVNVQDGDGDPVVNITTWYKNNVSTSVLYMPFEGNGKESTNATDYSGYGNNGTVFGPAWNRTGGKIGGAYQFDGIDDYIDIVDSNSLNTTLGLSIEVWVKPIDAERVGEDRLVVGKYVSSVRTFSITENDDAGLANDWDFYLSSSCTSTGGNAHASDDAVNNTWQYLVGTWNGTDMVLFKNGVKIANASFTGPICGQTTPLRMGNNSYRQSFRGSIDNVIIYNYSLSQEQILANYQAGLAGLSSYTIKYEEAEAGEEWICSVTPNDGYSDGVTKNSTYVKYNSAPDAPSNITCNGGTCNLTFDSNILLNCSGAIDINSDVLTYTIEKGNNTPDLIPHTLNMTLITNYSNNAGAGSIEGARGMQYDSRGFLVVSATTDDYMTVINITNPESLTVVGSVTDAAGAGSIDGNWFGTLVDNYNPALNNRIYTAANIDDIIGVYNITRSNPVWINGTSVAINVNTTPISGSLESPYDIVPVSVGSQIFTVIGSSVDDTLSVYNFTDINGVPRVPEATGFRTTLANPCTTDNLRGLYNLDGTTLVVGASITDDSIVVYNVTPDGNVSCVDDYTDSAGAGSVDGVQDFYFENSTKLLYVPSAVDGYLTILNATDTINSGSPLVLVGSALVGTGTLTLVSATVGEVGPDKFAFVGDSAADQGIRVFNVTNPASPSYHSQFNQTVGTCLYNGVYSLNVVDNYLFASSGVDACFYSIRLYQNTDEYAKTFTVLGNHSAGETYTWDISGEANGEVYEALRCKAIDTNGSEVYSDYLTMNTNITLHTNTPPLVSAIAFNPAVANTSSNIQCNATITDAQQSTVTVEYWWYNSSTFMLGGNTSGVSVGTNTVISTLGSGNTTKGELWNCTIRANDGIVSGTYNSTSVTIVNSAPAAPTLITPTNGNLTFHDRSPFFDWTSADDDNDQLNYTINVTFSSAMDCGADLSTNASESNYTAITDYCVDRYMNWTVRAYDGTSYSEWSSKWNFTIESYISINLTTNGIDFGTMPPLSTRDTDNGYSPLVIENQGNIIINISRISANASPFTFASLNTIYFRFKADNVTSETPSYNWTASQTVWANLTDVALLNQTVIRELDYNDSHDSAQIDINISIPTDEPPGQKKVTLYVVGEQS